MGWAWGSHRGGCLSGILGIQAASQERDRLSWNLKGGWDFQKLNYMCSQVMVNIQASETTEKLKEENKNLSYFPPRRGGPSHALDRCHSLPTYPCVHPRPPLSTFHPGPEASAVRQALQRLLPARSGLPSQKPARPHTIFLICSVVCFSL